MSNTADGGGKAALMVSYESVQLVTFLNTPPQYDALALWSAAMATAPTGFQTPAPGHSQAQGVYGTGGVQLLVQPARVDLVYSAPPAASPSLAQPGLGDLDAVVTEGLRAMSALLPHLAVGRAAAVFQTLDKAEDAVDASRKIGQLVPIPIREGATSANYETLVPRDSKVVEGRVIQHLCRWNSVVTQTIDLRSNAVAASQIFGALTYIDIYGEVMEALDQDGARAAIDEVVEIAARITKGGFDELR